jgi:hypothetical protein
MEITMGSVCYLLWTRKTPGSEIIQDSTLEEQEELLRFWRVECARSLWGLAPLGIHDTLG